MADYTSKQSKTNHMPEATAASGPWPGKRTLVEQAYDASSTVQRQAVKSSDASVHEAAARGTATPASSLPHLDLIQRAFGRHDVSSVQAHVGGDAAESTGDMGARAYATGNHVVLGQGADLFTEAHEAAHVVQQRGGVQLKGGVGEEGDPHERHADEVASLVVQGKSAEGLLDKVAVPGGGIGGGVQRQAQRQGSGEKWPGGPTVERKSTTHTLAEYLGWLRQVEAKYGAQRAETLQRLRRLYYSSHTGGAGPRFDAVIKGAPGAGDPPMTTSDLPIGVINGLFETNAIVTPHGTLVDVSHIFAGLDIHVQGGGFKAGVAAARFDVNFEGVLTWVGDLSSWFVEAKNAIKQREQQESVCLAQSEQVTILLGLVNNKAAKDDLLGDVDAQVMVDRFTTTTYLPSPSLGGQPSPGTFVTTQDIPLSEMLSRYYGVGQPTTGTGEGSGEGSSNQSGNQTAGPTSSNRFHHFVAGSRPRIPHTVVSTNPLQVALASDASTQIRQHIHNTARLFIDQGFFSSTPQDLTTYASLLDEVNTRFVRFLTTGLASGDSPWP